MSPDNSKTPLGLEYFCSEGDELWNMEDEDLIKLGMKELEIIGLGRKKDFIDGFVQRIDDEVTPLGASNVFTRTASVKDDVDDLIALVGATNSAVLSKDGNYIYMSIPNYMALMKELRDDNNFHYQSGELESFKFVYPYSKVTIVGVDGLAGNNSLIFANKMNLMVGTDLVSDFEEVKFRYSEDNFEHRFHMNFRLGTQIAVPAEIFAANPA